MCIRDRLFDGGRLHTGDLGFLDEDGALTVTGRISDLIIRGGKNIDPTAIEARLQSLEWVEDVLAVGIDDDRLGQRVGVMMVVVAGSAEAQERDLAASLAAETGQPIDDVAFVSTIPTNELGKPIRAVPLSTFNKADIVEA